MDGITKKKERRKSNKALKIGKNKYKCREERKENVEELLLL